MLMQPRYFFTKKRQENRMNVEYALKFATEQIGGSDNNIKANIDARYIVSYILQKDFTWLRAWQDQELSNEQKLTLEGLVERRKCGEPIAYITREKDFWSLTLETNSSTLIPRPETELLVENALEFLKDRPIAKILDLGTGTGAIALAIASERKNDSIVATDIVQDAVELATRNAEKNNINNVKILQSDWFSNITESKFDLIVSNPPYVEESDPHLSQGDLRFEPSSALTSGDNGLADIKIIIAESRGRLVRGGMLMIEHGFEQGKKVRNMYVEQGFSEVETVIDLSDLDRITVGLK